jgi:signal transduction histidine kinase
MDHMTSSKFLLTQGERVRANWPALLLPLVVVLAFGVTGNSAWTWLVIAAAAMAFLAPRVTAKVTPFAVMAYGGDGLFRLHSMDVYEAVVIHYGIVTATRATRPITDGFQLLPQTVGVEAMLAEAMVFLVCGVWLLVVTGGPGSRAIRHAVAELRGSEGQPKTVPPLLLIPVVFLCEELFSEHLWFGGGTGSGLFAVLPFAAALAVIRWRPFLAAAVALAGVLLLGIYGTCWGVHWLWIGGSGGHPIDVDSPHFGLVLLDGGLSELFAGLQGVALLALAAMLVPRLLTWGGDLEMARRAQALTQRVDRLTRTRSDATDTAVAELRRIERDLHDGAQARLVAVGMSLRAAEELMGTNPEAARALVAEARKTSSRALDDLRGLVRGIYPPVLADRGLADAVRALALDAPIAVDTDITIEEEPPMPVAAAVYFAIAEALTNAVRHSGADAVEIGIGHCGDMLRATIVDDGLGGADPAAGTGLSGVERRLATFDGILAVTSPAGGPTIVVIEVPCTLAPADEWPRDASWTDVVRSSWQTRTLI